MTSEYDIAVLGSGFGGSLIAMIARNLGLRVLMIERGSHPRFAIGESTSPLANLLLEEIAHRYELPFLLPFCTYGNWKRTYPEVVCGLKRGFTYYEHHPGRRFTRNADHSDQLLVAASPRDDIADTHWLRSSFDSFLVDHAVERGVEYSDHTTIEAVRRDENHLWTVKGVKRDGRFEVTTRLLIDATGPRGLLQRLLGIPEVELPGFPKTQALFSHFTGVLRCDEMEEFRVLGEPPYLPDDAALHHIVDGGWMWVLRFDNGVTSAGFSVTDEAATELGLPGDHDRAWRRFLDKYPSIGAQFAVASATFPLMYSPRLSYCAERAAGPGWVMLPSAAAFLDPLFSTGIPLTLLGIERIAKILAESWETDLLDAELHQYGETTLQDVRSTAEYIGGSLRSLKAFPSFTALSMFYFAAASYSEMARRTNQRQLVTRFLAADRADFRDGMRKCIQRIDGGPGRMEDITCLTAQGIDVLNIAGLADLSKRNWYGVDLQDVIDNSLKLDLSQDEMRKLIAEADWV